MNSAWAPEVSDIGLDGEGFRLPVLVLQRPCSVENARICNERSKQLPGIGDARDQWICNGDSLESGRAQHDATGTLNPGLLARRDSLNDAMSILALSVALSGALNTTFLLLRPPSTA